MLALETIIEENMGLVRSVALRFRDRGTDFDDLVQIGTIGMIKAVRSFEVSREVVFSTYAVPLIMGEIKRHLRDDGPIKVSRIYKKLSMEIGRVRNKILTDEGREPSILELAELCGVAQEEVAIALETVNPITSLSETFGEDDKLTLESQLASNDREIEKMNDKIALGQAISNLPRDWQKIITMRYYRNMTQQQVADALGLSQVKISREEKKILAALRQELMG
jgi:RNA polymerase sporulation-specific sigma factor